MTLSQSDFLGISGIPTFLRAPQGSLEDLSEGMVAVAGVTYDLSSTSKIGARFAPRSIRLESGYNAAPFSAQGDIVEVTTGQRMKAPDVLKIIDLGDFIVFPVEWDKMAESLRGTMHRIAGTGALPIILGGDHFISYPLVQGFADAVTERGGKKIGYIQLSSQLDLGDQDPVWGDVWRGSTARRIMDTGAVDASNMVWIGVNGYIRTDQWELAHELDLKVFTLNDIRREGIESIAQQAAEIAGEGCDSVYLSVDIDVLDGGYVSMTDAPVFDGLTNVDLLKAIDVLRMTNVGAMDLVGMNPAVDWVGAIGPRFATWLIVRFISQKILVRV